MPGGHAPGHYEAAAAAFQAGVWVAARPGESLRDFMAASLGFPAAYIEGSVSTVFLDASPVDDIDAAVVRPGCLIALSGAMPGLVGAVMRRRSPYASFRKAISHSGGADAPFNRPAGEEAAAGDAARGDRVPGGREEPCLVRLKLFNAVLRDMGGIVLERGAWIESARAGAFAAAAYAEPEGDRRPAAELRSRGAGGSALAGRQSSAAGLPGAPAAALVRLPG